MRRGVVWAALCGVAALAGGAAAAPLVLGSGKVGAGTTAVGRCDTDGFTHAYTTSRGNVTSVTVGGLADPGCEGGTIHVTVTSSSGDSIASGGPQAIPVDAGTVDNSVTISTSPQPSATQVAGIHIVVEGP